MYDFGFTLRGPETLTPAQFSITSTLPPGGLKRLVEDLIKAELQVNVFVDEYETKQFGTTRPPDSRRFRWCGTSGGGYYLLDQTTAGED